MSSFEPPKPDRKGPEAFLDTRERQNLARMLSFPEDLPPKFKSWLLDYVATNVSGIPASSITGGDRATISARLTRTADQTGWSGGVRDNVVFTVAEWDDAGMWDNTTKLTAPRKGKYLVTASAEFTTDTGQMEVWKNNVTREAGASTASGANVTTVLNLDANDFVQLKVVPNGSGMVLHAEANTTPILTLTRVS